MGGGLLNIASFNPRPREGATGRGRPQTRPPERFNPRPREGATGWWSDLGGNYGVSIHAPVKGRPAIRTSFVVGTIVSIHAPVKGRRLLYLRYFYDAEFQSTPP